MASENPKRDTGLRLPRFVDLLLVLLAALATYWPALNSPFVFDDLQIIVGNDHVHEGDAGTIFGSGYWDGYNELLGEQQALYRPLTVQTYAWNWAAGGEHPAGFRAANIFLHALTSILVLGLLRKILMSRPGAFVGALLFAVHPIQTEAVTYIAGRADVLAALFFFGAWLVFTSMEGLRGGARRSMYAASLGLFGLALLSKEMAATLPAVLMLFDFVARLQQRESLSGGLGYLRKRWQLYAGYFAVLGAFLALRAAVLGAVMPAAGMIKERANPLAELSLMERFDDAMGLLGRELALLVYPQPLSVDYSFGAIPVSRELFAAESLPYSLLALVALVFAMLLLLRRSHLMLAAGLLFFFGTLFPVSNLAFVIGTNMGERVLYLVSFAAALTLGAGVRWWLGKSEKAFPLVVLASASLMLFAGWRTLVRNVDYKSGYRLFEAATKAYPAACRAQFNFGVYASERGDELVQAGEGKAAQAEFALATSAYQQALKSDPGYQEARFELGRFAQKRGDWTAAAHHFQGILESGAEAQAFPDAVTGFADACLAKSEAERGRRVLRQHIKGRESLSFPYELAQGLLEAALENDEAAREHFERLLALPAPDDEVLRVQLMRAMTELARLEARLGEHARAKALFEQAIAYGPDSLGPHLYRIEYLRSQQLFAETAQAILEASARFPANYLLVAENGHLARAQGNMDLALAQYSQALAAQPRHGASQNGILGMGLEQLERARSGDLSEQETLQAWTTTERILRSALSFGARKPGLQLDYYACLRALGRWREASAGFEAIAKQGGPRAAAASAEWGDCLSGLGEWDAARAAYGRALQLDGQLERARLGLEWLDEQANSASVL
ncbi:MAG: tetratricopeptide (TPR) repeat protein, partial [Candidatus Paceibacteria bacterium]